MVLLYYPGFWFQDFISQNIQKCYGEYKVIWYIKVRQYVYILWMRTVFTIQV